MTGILIADSEVPFVFQMVQFLTERGYHLTGLAKTADKAVDLSRRLKPDLILMDIRLSEGLDGITAASEIRNQQNTPIVFVTSHASEDCLKKAKQVHPEGYVLKPFNGAQIQAAIEMALTNEEDQPPAHDDLPIPDKWEGPVHDDHLQDPLLTLTATELNVARRIKMGQRTQVIAKCLNIRSSTVRWHRRNIRKKLGLTGTKMGLMGKLMFVIK